MKKCKKLIVFILCFSMISTVLGINGTNKKVYAGDEDFIIVDGELIRYVGNGGDVVIPETVTAIGKKAFSE